jgi:hypothetical protein
VAPTHIPTSSCILGGQISEFILPLFDKLFLFLKQGNTMYAGAYMCRPDSGGCRRFSRRSCPVSTSNERIVAPAWPDSAATTVNENKKANKRKMKRKKERRTVSILAELSNMICWRIEHLPPNYAHQIKSKKTQQTRKENANLMNRPPGSKQPTHRYPSPSTARSSSSVQNRGFGERL